MLGNCIGAVLDGILGAIVHVEADISNGIPHFHIVGLPDSAINESKLRVRAAFRNAGLAFPTRKITVNLSPASLKKRGAGLDLAIAVAILRAAGEIPDTFSHRIGFCAELSLSGQLVPVPGIVNLGLAMHSRGVDSVVVSGAQSTQCLEIPGLQWWACETLQALVQDLRNPGSSPGAAVGTPLVLSTTSEEDLGDFSDVIGLDTAKRALAIAAAGQHHTLLVGPPGTGKSMLADRTPGILPPLSHTESLEVFAIHQAYGIPRSPSLAPPLRSPHHTLTPAGMIGGGAPPSPGEATLAHHGVLLLNEVLEFPRQTLDSLREPLSNKWIRINRAGYSSTLPADFLLIGTLNPCPCGEYGYGECRCLDTTVRQYWSRLSGPLLDRISVMVQVDRQTTVENAPVVSSQQARATVVETRVQLGHRLAELATHGQRDDADVALSAQVTMEKFARHRHLSRRAQVSLLQLARTISLFERADLILTEHVEEACSLHPQPAVSGRRA